MARVRVPAVLGFYDDAHDLSEVAGKANHEKGFKDLDAYSPYPIHGIEEQLGLKSSWVTIPARLGLVFGAFLGFSFQSWTSSVSWAVNIGGKPYISWPAWIPITFEAGVLMAAFCNLTAMFIACGLYPKLKTIVLSKRITNDRFVLVIPVKDDAEEAEAVSFLRENKALKIKIVDALDKEKGRLVFRSAPLAGEGAPA